MKFWNNKIGKGENIMEPINADNINMNNPVSPSSPIGQPKKPFNAKLVAILAGAAIFVGAGVFAAMYPWGAGKVDNVAVSPTPTQTLTPTPSTSATADETADWQTYRNEKYGFEVKYPQGWAVLPATDEFAVHIYKKSNTAAGDNRLIINIPQKIYNGPTEISPDERLIIDKNNHPDFENVAIAGKSAITYKIEPTSQSPGNTIFEFVNNSRLYILTVLYGKNGSDGVGDQILSTFKFTEPVAATSDSVKIFLIAPDDNGIIGKKVGCGDSAVSVSRSIAPTSGPLKAALGELFSFKEKDYGQSGLYNALYQSKANVDSVKITDGRAEVRLSGSIVSGGACDNPRIQAQIEETIKQFSAVKSFAIFFNGSEENYRKLFSGR